MPEPLKRYVVGFLFSDDPIHAVLLLIRKERPEWQRGRLNGVGGKIEEGETPLHAMGREAAEEIGLERVEWKLRVRLWRGEEWEVFFYTATASWRRLQELRSRTDEAIELVNTWRLPNDTLRNLRWLIPLALDPCTAFAEIEERAAR